jgi:hypothetical protein
MLCKMLRHTNPVSLRNLFFTSVVIAIFVLACSQNPIRDGWSIELREVEHKGVKHPEKHYFASILPGGLRVSFDTTQGHFGIYEFPHKEFPLGETAFLLCPGSPDFLPMRVVRLNEANDYKIEWLAKSPATSDGRKVVRSH